MRYVVLAVFLSSISLVYGIGVGTYKIFPYQYIQDVKRYFLGRESKNNNPRLSLFGAFDRDVNLVFIGDSLTERGLWSEWLPRQKIANRGVEGDTGRDILARMPTIISTKPELAFIQLGINDLYEGQTPDEILIVYIEILEKLSSENIRIVVQSTPECSTSRCEDKLMFVRQLNLDLMTYASENGMFFMDINPLISDANGLRHEFTPDGIHLNGAGYREWVKLVDLTLNELGTTTTNQP